MGLHYKGTLVLYCGASGCCNVRACEFCAVKAMGAPLHSSRTFEYMMTKKRKHEEPLPYLQTHAMCWQTIQIILAALFSAASISHACLLHSAAQPGPFCSNAAATVISCC